MYIYRSIYVRIRIHTRRRTCSKLIQTCNLTSPYETWLIHMRLRTHSGLIRMRRDSFVCDVTHSHATQNTFWTHSYIQRDSSTWDMTHSHVSHDSSTRDSEHILDSLTWDVTHSNETWLIHTRRRTRSESAPRVSHVYESHRIWMMSRPIWHGPDHTNEEHVLCLRPTSNE